MPTIAEFTVEVNVKLDEILKGLKRAERSTDQTTRKMETRFRSVGRTIRNLAGAFAVAFSGREIARFTKDTLAWAQQLEITANRLGLTTRELQALQQAADRTGQSVRAAEIGVQRFARRLGEAIQGGGEARIVLDQLGITARVVGGEFETTFDVLIAALEAVSEIEDPTRQIAALFKLVDTEGVEAFTALLPILTDNVELTELLGRALNDDVVRGAAAASEAVRIFTTNTEQSLRRITTGVMANFLIALDDINAVLSGFNVFGIDFGATRSVQAMELAYLALEAQIADANVALDQLAIVQADIVREGGIIDQADLIRLNNAVLLVEALTDRQRKLGEEIKKFGGIVPDTTPAPPISPGTGGPTELTEAQARALELQVERERRTRLEIERLILTSYDDLVGLVKLREAERLRVIQEALDAGVISEEKAGAARAAAIDSAQREIDDLFVKGEEEVNVFNDAMLRSIDILGNIAAGGEVSARRVAVAFARMAANIIQSLDDVQKKAIATGIVNLVTSVVGAIGGAFSGGFAGGSGTPTGTTTGASAFGAQFAQHGGRASGLTVVGERGPELVNFKSPGRVFPNHAMAGAAAGGGGDVIVNIRNENQTADVSASRKNPGVVDIIIGTVTQDIASGGPVSRSMERMYGSQRRGRVR